jgi:putative transcriptional regulator
MATNGKKKTVGQDLIQNLRELNRAIKNGESISEKFTCDRVILDLQPRDYTPAMVKRTRKLLGVSQGLFAQFLCVSAGTVKAWEQGTNPVPGIACRFFDELNRAPEHFKKVLKDSVIDKQYA